MSLATEVQGLSSRRSELPFPESRFPVYSEFGIDLHNHGSDSEDERLQALRDWVALASDTPRGTGVFMDNTSLFSAFALVTSWERTNVPANVLLDLDTFVRCVVLYDHIFHLDANPNGEYRKFDSRVLNERLGYEQVVVPIPVDLESYEHGVSGP